MPRGHITNIYSDLEWESVLFANLAYALEKHWRSGGLKATGACEFEKNGEQC